MFDRFAIESIGIELAANPAAHGGVLWMGGIAQPSHEQFAAFIRIAPSATGARFKALDPARFRIAATSPSRPTGPAYDRARAAVQLLYRSAVDGASWPSPSKA